MSRRGRGRCPLCKRVLTTSVSGRMLRHNTTEPFPGVLGERCQGQGYLALPEDEPPAETKIEVAAFVQVAPVPAGNLGAVALCPFRVCPWHSTGLPGAPEDVQETVVARHLLAEHRDALATLGAFARDAGLL